MVKLIAFDADDTLWHTERLFRFTEAQFADILRDYADKEMLEKCLLDIVKRNLGLYGYGIKGFTLSMIETALEVTEGRVPSHVIKAILDGGQAMVRTQVETFPGAQETLEKLKADYKLVMITKGDLFDQERKLAESRLGDYFDAVEVVSNKDRNTYETLFARHGENIQSSVMVGNSLPSDIIPALEAGGIGIYVPYEITWVLEMADEPLHHPHYHKVQSLSEVPNLVRSLSRP